MTLPAFAKDTRALGIFALLLFAAMVGLSLPRGPRSAPASAADGLPGAITPNLDDLPPVAAPGVASPAEIDELLAFQAKRTEVEAQEARAWQAGAVLRWNEIARGLVSKYNTSPVVASRVFALLSVVQHDALLAAIRAQRRNPRAAAASEDKRLAPLFPAAAASAYPSEHAVIAAASAAVLGFVFASKEQIAQLEKQAAAHEESRLFAGVSRRSEIAAGDALGKAVAARVIAWAKTDKAAQAGVNWQGAIPTGAGKWASSEHPPVVPLRARWGEVRPWLMSAPDQFRPPPPPDPDSPAFQKDLDELREISKTRTPEQLRIAKFWSDAPGSPTPPGHWNGVAAALLADRHVDELVAARVLAYLNMAVMDAGISCWEAKYHYWFFRPTQADPTISIPIGLPNFPSYTSGHSTFSGAAAEVLGHFFPADAKRLTEMATEASLSRMYGGIHYRFDGEEGLKEGRAIGRLAAEREAETANGYHLPVP
ncbi:MAG: phosphatase PAP2 family protein [Minicystis sp.]